MDRQIVYPGQIPLETDLLKTNQNTMIAIAKLASAMFGSSTIVNGLTVTAQSPAAMAVNVSAGEIYELANLEATTYSSLAADTTHSIMKQGISLNTQALAITAPGTAGYSINYLIQATYQDSDSNAATLPYYNSSNPSQAWSGPNNSGTQQYTTRSGAVVVLAKAGVAATTGSQATPSPDSGYVGLYVVTVAYGASTITSANISQYSGAPLLPSGLLQSIQNGNTSFATDTGAANAYVISLTPALTARSEGQVIRLKVANTNTGASTINDGLGVVPLTGGAHSALQGGEMVVGGDALVQWNSTVGTGSYVLLSCTGAPEQLANGAKSQHAAALNQITSVVGSARNVAMSVTSASSTATLSADEIIVETALGGLKYQLSNFSKSVNLATTGAGGMDTGTAPVSGYVALYAIFNPTTSTSALLATNATSAKATEVYSGANMPSGYTASALVFVWPTNASGQLTIGEMVGRRIRGVPVSFLSTSGSGTSNSYASLSVAGCVPKNAKKIFGTITITNGTVSSFGSVGVAPTASVGAQTVGGYVTTNIGPFATFEIDLATAQTLYYVWYAAGGGTITFSANCSGYEI